MSCPARARVYFFGAWSRTQLGHQFYGPGGRGVYSEERKTLPVQADQLDGTLAPKRRPERAHNYDGDYPPGLATCYWRTGWTFVAFWDQSADARGASNTVLIVEGYATFEEAMREASAAFPERLKDIVVQLAPLTMWPAIPNTWPGRDEDHVPA